MKQVDISLWEINPKEAKQLPEDKPVLRYNNITGSYRMIKASAVKFTDSYIYFFILDLNGVPA